MSVNTFESGAKGEATNKLFFKNMKLSRSGKALIEFCYKSHLCTIKNNRKCIKVPLIVSLKCIDRSAHKEYTM